jgi:hypothetical protein
MDYNVYYYMGGYRKNFNNIPLMLKQWGFGIYS